MGIKEKIKKIPKSPGIYMLEDEKGNALYIGKAKDLSKRVASYFQEGRPRSARQMSLLENVKDLEYIVTASEEEALIYEASLVKEKRPKYNVELKDDKSFPFLKLTLNEKFPRLIITRKKVEDGSRYFGPYTKVKLLRKALSVMKGIFPLRTCRKIPKEACLSFHIGQCLGPCVGKIDEKTYQEIVRQLILFLQGKKQKLLKELTEKMKELSKKENFEEAVIVRNRIAALSEVPGKKLRGYSGWGDVSLKLKKLLRLPKLPLRVEAFDVSNISGKEASGSMVSFYNGKPDKSNYRKFRIKDVKDIDDYAMIREIVRRRYRRLKEEGSSFPDLIIIDGGKTHLQAGYDELMKLNLTHIPIISIAKEHENIWTLGAKVPLDINRDSEVLHFIQQIRDEAHRFALKYHHKLRDNHFKIIALFLALSLFMSRGVYGRVVYGIGELRVPVFFQQGRQEREEHWYQRETERLLAELDSTEDDAEIKRISEAFLDLHKKLIFMVIYKLEVDPESPLGQDLFQEGQITLLRLIRRELGDYDSMIANFFTYALWWLETYLRRYIRGDTLIHIPEDVQNRLSQMVRAGIILQEKLQRRPTNEELLAKLQEIDHGFWSDLDKIAEVRGEDVRADISYDILAAEQGVREQQGIDSGKHLAMGGASSLDVAVERKDLESSDIEELKNSIERYLSNEEQIIVCAHMYRIYGKYLGLPEMTLDELGRVFGLTRERIRQVEKKAVIALSQNKITDQRKRYNRGIITLSYEKRWNGLLEARFRGDKDIITRLKGHISEPWILFKVYLLKEVKGYNCVENYQLILSKSVEEIMDMENVSPSMSGNELPRSIEFLPIPEEIITELNQEGIENIYDLWYLREVPRYKNIIRKIGPVLEFLPAFIEARSGTVIDLNKVTADMEKRLIALSLAQTENNKAKAARLIGISRTQFYDKIRKYNLDTDELSKVEEPLHITTGIKSIKETVGELEKGLIILALVRANGNKTKAAEKLSITRPNLYGKLEKYGLEFNVSELSDLHLIRRARCNN